MKILKIKNLREILMLNMLIKIKVVRIVLYRDKDIEILIKKY